MKRLELRRSPRHMVWLIPVGLVVVNVVRAVAHAAPLGAPWQNSGGTLIDFRDLVVVPGRDLWHGGNPYDPRPYVAAHPWAQEFDPYSPAWLTISVLIGWLPLKVAATVYLLCMSVVSLLLARLLAVWASPTSARWWVAPAIASWLQIWYPSRSLSSSFLVVAGVSVTLFLLSQPSAPTARHQHWAAIGLATACLKPQFGLWFVLMLLALGAWRLVVRGIVYLCIAALPLTLWCVVDAGGPLELIRAVLRDLRYAAEDGPTGQVNATSYRFDLVGMWSRTWHSGAVIAYALSLAVLVVSMVVLWRRRAVGTSVPVIVPALVLLPVHLTYDIVAIVVPAAFLLGAWRVSPNRLLGGAAIVALIPVVHISIVNRLLGLGPLRAAWMDLICLMVVWACGVVVAIAHSTAHAGWWGRRRRSAPLPRRAQI